MPSIFIYHVHLCMSVRIYAYIVSVHACNTPNNCMYICNVCIVSMYDGLLLKSAVIFKVYDSDGDGEVTSGDVLEVLHDMSGPYLSEEQRQVIETSKFIITLDFIEQLI